jgi:hypothetical protein
VYLQVSGGQPGTPLVWYYLNVQRWAYKILMSHSGEGGVPAYLQGY